MIKNIPSQNDYEDVGFECLIQAYKNIYNIDNGELIPGVPREGIWKYNNIVLKTSVILIHQGIEALLKSKISKESPLLLLDQKRNEWKTLPNSGDTDFTDMYTISGEDLIRTFYATLEENKIDDCFWNHFEDVRILRNKIVHGISYEEIMPEKVLKLILWTFTYLQGKGSFWRALQNKFYDHPGHEVGDLTLDFEEVQQYNHLDYMETLLGKGELNNHFEIDLKSRRYYCPDCTGRDGIRVQKDDEENTVDIENHPTSKWAFLRPNTSESTNLFCLVCQSDFKIERKDCNIEEKTNCKGNVLYIDEQEEKDKETGEIFEEEVKICLTCMNSQIK